MAATGNRRRFLAASIAGAVPAFFLFAWMLAAGRADVLTREAYGNFFDAQARALLHGHWYVSARELGFEGFLVHGKTYTYFGPWPSILRMPFIELAPSTYGRLTQISMLLAFAVFLAGIIALHERIRELLRPQAPLRRGELALAVAVPLVLGCGSTAWFLASRAWVYHEATLWGSAWSIVAYERILTFTMRPRTGRLVAASAAAALAISSRGSVGLGPAVTLGLVLVGQVLIALHHRLSRADGSNRRAVAILAKFGWLGVRDDGSRRRWVGGLTVATFVPVASYSFVNWARFGSLLSTPWDTQLFFKINQGSGAALAANGGSWFNLRMAPTALLQYLRPDALAPDGLFPWVTFPRFRTPIIGHVIVAKLDFASSIPSSMPGLTVLAVVGIVGAIWARRFARTDEAARLRPLLVGTAFGVIGVVTIAFVAHRYLGDWLPMVAIASLAGMHVLLHRRETSTRPTRGMTTVIAVVAVLAIAGIWINGSLAIRYQRLINPTRATLRAGMLDFQYRVAGALGTGASDVKRLEALPRRPARSGTLAIVGRCDHLYWSDGRTWSSVGGRPAGGVVRIRAGVPPADGAWQPLVSWATPTGTQVVGLRRAGNGFKVARSVAGPDGSPTFNETFSQRIPVGHRQLRTFVVTVSRPLHQLDVTVDDVPALILGNQGDLPSGPATVGRANAPGVSASYAAPIRELPPDTGLCDRVRDAAR